MFNVILKPEGNHCVFCYQTSNCCVFLNSKTYLLTKKLPGIQKWLAIDYYYKFKKVIMINSLMLRYEKE